MKDIEGLFVQVLKLAREMGMLNLGTVGLDGTKVHANASRHSAPSAFRGSSATSAFNCSSIFVKCP